MTVHNEVCPWCSKQIVVSYGTRPCPACKQLIRVYHDAEEGIREILRTALGELSLGTIGRMLFK